MDLKKLANQYKDELLNNVLPFWLEHSQDHEFGGYFTCLDREGNVFDTDKFIWLQGREVWLFSMLYNKVEKKQEWLDCAIQGGEFLKNHTTSFPIHLLQWHSDNSAWLQAIRNMLTLQRKRSILFSQRQIIRKVNGTKSIRAHVI